MSNKTKNFSFDTKEKDIFQSQPKAKRNLGGRPTKALKEKLSVAKTVKFTTDENEQLMAGFEKVKTQYSSFASYLRHLVLKGGGVI